MQFCHVAHPEQVDSERTALAKVQLPVSGSANFSISKIWATTDSPNFPQAIRQLAVTVGQKRCGTTHCFVAPARCLCRTGAPAQAQVPSCSSKFMSSTELRQLRTQSQNMHNSHCSTPTCIFHRAAEITQPQNGHLQLHLHLETFGHWAAGPRQFRLGVAELPPLFCIPCTSRLHQGCPN